MDSPQALYIGLGVGRMPLAPVFPELQQMPEQDLGWDGEAVREGESIEQAIQWQVSVPVFRSAVILKQLGLAIGVPFGLLAAILVLASGQSVYTLYALGLIAALLLLTWLFIMVVYRGRYNAELVLDGRGVTCRTQAQQAQKNRVVNALAVVLGLASGKPAVAGAGMLASARQSVYLRWNEVTTVEYLPRQRTIVLRGGPLEHIALFCTEENHEQIRAIVREKTKGQTGP